MADARNCLSRLVKFLNSKGSFTIEAILIMSTLLVIIFLLCFSFMLMYHRVLIQQTASTLAREAALVWQQEEQKLEPQQLAKIITLPEGATVKIQYERGLITQEIQVGITQEVEIPFGLLKGFFTGQNFVLLTAEEKVLLTEPADFIRNTDLVMECVERVGQKVDLNEFFSKIKGK